MDVEEKPVFSAAKRCGLEHIPCMNDWFVSWSPRNDNCNAEGHWAHWANLAAHILSHPATQAVAPHLYRPDLQSDPEMYSECPVLTEEQVRQFFAPQPGAADGVGDTDEIG